MKIFLNKYWHILCYLFGPLLIILGIFVNNNESNTLSHLQKTQGKILISEYSLRSSGTKTSSSYSLNVKYSYKVDNKIFENNQIGLARFSYSSEESAKQELTKYPVNKTVDVFYLPSNPQEAYLDIEQVGNGEILILLGVLSIIFIVPVVWIIEKSIKNKSSINNTLV